MLGSSLNNVCLYFAVLQKWYYNNTSGDLLSESLKLCATHVTDPDVSQNSRQIVMAQDCRNDKNNEQFKKWTFVLPWASLADWTDEGDEVGTTSVDLNQNIIKNRIIFQLCV